MIFKKFISTWWAVFLCVGFYFIPWDFQIYIRFSLLLFQLWHCIEHYVIVFVEYIRYLVCLHLCTPSAFTQMPLYTFSRFGFTRFCWHVFLRWKDFLQLCLLWFRPIFLWLSKWDLFAKPPLPFLVQESISYICFVTYKIS